MEDLASFSKRPIAYTRRAVPVTSSSHLGLDTIDRFVTVANEIAAMPVLRSPGFTQTAGALYDISRKLLIANENLARWLNRFLYFDFQDDGAGRRFRKTVRKYRNAKAAGKLREMKFRCGDIRIIYDKDIGHRLPEMYPDEQAQESTAIAFSELYSADIDMVNLIYNDVVAGIERFCAEAGDFVDHSKFNEAEALRLEYKVSSADLSQHVERLADRLSDLVLKFAQVTGRPVSLRS